MNARTIIPAGDRQAGNVDALRPQWAAIRAVVAAIDALRTASDVDMVLLEDALDRLAARSEDCPGESCDACAGTGVRYASGPECRECDGRGVL